MLFRILEHPISYILILSGLAASILVCVFPEMIPSLSWVLNYAVQMMLLYLVAGVAMLFLKQPRLTFAFFGGCVILCFFLKYSVKSDGLERWRQNISPEQTQHNSVNIPPLSTIKIAHINLTNTNERNELFAIIRASGADLVSLHEVTPDWIQTLKDSLDPDYPFHHTLVDIGIFGMAVYSKKELTDIDTFYYEEIPNLTGKARVNNETIEFICSHTLPALDAFSKRRLREHLEVIREKVNMASDPVVLFGDFNAVAWSTPIQSFLNETGLLESRAGFMPVSSEGTFSFWDLPLDHIFFSSHFKCVNFENLPGFQGQHLGIAGKYQFPFAIPHAKKISK